MKEEWLLHGAVVPVDVETTAALVAEIHRLIDVIGGIALAQPAQEPVAWMHTNSRKIFVLQKPFNWEIFTPLYTTPPQRERVVFPTMLRKMWSGGEVQAWLDENVNKEKNT